MGRWAGVNERERSDTCGIVEVCIEARVVLWRCVCGIVVLWRCVLRHMRTCGTCGIVEVCIEAHAYMILSLPV